MLTSQMLVDMMLLPFEDAMRSIINFLGAKKIDVYLFDSDRFFTHELKTDGNFFIFLSTTSIRMTPTINKPY
jgi:hypothetical protein